MEPDITKVRHHKNTDISDKMIASLDHPLAKKHQKPPTNPKQNTSEKNHCQFPCFQLSLISLKYMSLFEVVMTAQQPIKGSISLESSQWHWCNIMLWQFWISPCRRDVPVRSSMQVTATEYLHYSMLTEFGCRFGWESRVQEGKRFHERLRLP